MEEFDREEFDKAQYVQDAREGAVCWARRVLELGERVVILDTETTGVTASCEVIQAAGMGLDGRLLFDRLFRPLRPIPEEARKIHHISNERVRNAPRFAEAYPELCRCLAGKVVAAYNAWFDRRMLAQTCLLYGLEEIEVERWTCAMTAYAKYFGAWSDYHHNFCWQPLPGGNHSAAGDCRATLKLIRRMAEGKPARKMARRK